MQEKTHFECCAQAWRPYLRSGSSVQSVAAQTTFHSSTESLKKRVYSIFLRQSGSTHLSLKLLLQEMAAGRIVITLTLIVQFAAWTVAGTCVDDCSVRPLGYYQSCDGCGTFVACVWGKLVTMQCPKGTVWDDGWKLCLWISDTCQEVDTSSAPKRFPFAMSTGDSMAHRFTSQFAGAEPLNMDRRWWPSWPWSRRRRPKPRPTSRPTTPRPATTPAPTTTTTTTTPAPTTTTTTTTPAPTTTTTTVPPTTTTRPVHHGVPPGPSSYYPGSEIYSKSGIKCNFPFKAFGKIYNNCTTDYVTVKIPWCSLTYDYNKDRKMGYCDFSMKFPLECLQTSRGFDYKGYQRRTVSGRTCQAWAAQQPHGHANCKLQSRSNYCTNVDNPSCREAQPWCYTTDPGMRWELCDIPKCLGRILSGQLSVGRRQEALPVVIGYLQRVLLMILEHNTRLHRTHPEDGPRSAKDEASTSCDLLYRQRLNRH
ncbi:hypothetical protein LSAT2_025036 [Lamellibrachia satsuma]|nr:hypothetical protein LSAT2_025036 [Lamellibrachia satsuma]